MRKKVIIINYLKLVAASVSVALFSAILADSLKKITAYYENYLFKQVSHLPWAFVLLPSIGITLIYFLRKYLFKGKQNKGIKEIYVTLESRKNDLPAYKIPSHYFNGFLTVALGGSTGVEVATVVATAAIGASAHKRTPIANLYKTELICAGVAAGIATLFSSPLAGFLFAIEVIARKIDKTIFISSTCAAIISWLFMHVIEGDRIFAMSISEWRLHAIPYFILLSLLAGAIAVYFTRIALFIKEKFGRINNNFIKVNAGAIIVGLAILCFPELYGDSYHAIPQLLAKLSHEQYTVGIAFLLLSITMLKPLVASLTLGAGGDGGVFAPSLVAGAVLGMLVATTCNHYFHAHLIVLNFAIMGAATVLSAAIHAPFTSLFLACNLVMGGYLLFIPLLFSCLLSKYFAQYLCSYTVYTYKGKLARGH